MTGNIKVGYMGIPFSNTEEMAITLTGDEGIDNIELVPLVSAANVVDALLSGSVTYGVLAIRNKFAGPVIESVLAQQGRNITVIRTKWCHIHHCVFTKTKIPKYAVFRHTYRHYCSPKKISTVYTPMRNGRNARIRHMPRKCFLTANFRKTSRSYAEKMRASTTACIWHMKMWKITATI
jgi:prephenate dehydratase